MSKKAASAPLDPSTSFEDALKELEQIVDRLERGDTSLEESITLYERGAALKSHCESKLASAQEKIDKIVIDSAGAPGAAPLDVE